MRIGIDVGGTNTDAVLMDGKRLLASAKRPTSIDVTSGIVAAIDAILGDAGVPSSDIDAVMIGTTHFTNALVECKHLSKVAVIRLASPSGEALPPTLGWPDAVRHAVDAYHLLLPGGYEFDGREISPFHEGAVREAAREIRRQGILAVAISSVFGPVNPSMEQRAAKIVHETVPDARVSLSTEIGRIGFIDRENATILNATLSQLSDRVIDSFSQALQSHGITAPFFISQNDGTLMSAEAVKRYPVFTIASGPTNSMRGAAYLTGYKDAIVMDVGGTTADVGVLMGGFPRESSVNAHIGGVSTNFRMPDVYALGLGGGSRVLGIGPEEDLQIGPDSIGCRLTEDAVIFGGRTLTASDIAVAAGLADFGNKRYLDAWADTLTPAFLDQAIAHMTRKFEGAIDRVKTSPGAVPLILVGGGAVLVSDKLKGVSEILRPDHSAVANAIGAAITQVGSEIERVVSLEKTPRKEALASLQAEAIQRAIEAGGKEGTATIVDVDEVAIAYLKGHSVRMRVKAVADLAATI